jgi:hypothetical protein
MSSGGVHQFADLAGCEQQNVPEKKTDLSDDEQEMDWELPTGTFEAEKPAERPVSNNSATVQGPSRWTFEEVTLANLAELPDSFRFQEGSRLGANDPYQQTAKKNGSANMVHRVYCGRDSYKFDEISASRKRPARIVFHDANRIKPSLPVAYEKIGFMSKAHVEEKDKNRVIGRVSFMTYSQFSGVRVYIQWKDRNVDCKIFGSCFASSGLKDEITGFSLQHYQNPSDEKLIQAPFYADKEIMDIAKENNLLGIGLKLWQPEEVEQAKGMKTRPSFHGITARELHTIVTAYKSDSSDNLSEAEKLIALLATSSTFSIYRRVDLTTADNASSDNFVQYMRACMYFNIRKGCLWFYRLQWTMPLMAKEFPLDDMEVPRWLVKCWQVEKNADDKVLSVKPSKWSPLPPVWEFPDMASCAFLASLGVTREREHSTRAIQRMIGKQDGTLQAIFRQIPQIPEQYLVDIFVPGSIKELPQWKMKPVSDTRLRITTMIDGKKFIFSGSILDDVFVTKDNEKGDFIAGVHGRDVKLSKKKIDIELELIDDGTSANRALNSIERLYSGTSRDCGVDLGHLLFGGPPSISEDRVNWLAQYLGEEKVDAIIKRLRENHNLNEGQANAAIGYVKNATHIVWGLAGTGKTTTVSAAVG